LTAVKKTFIRISDVFILLVFAGKLNNAVKI